MRLFSGHSNVRFVDVFHADYCVWPSQHALRFLRYIIDKEKAWGETTVEIQTGE